MPADALILDLEDAVAPDAKDTAREHAAAAVEAGGYGGREVVIRINGLDTPWGRPTSGRVARPAPTRSCVPKVGAAEGPRASRAMLGRRRPKTALWAMMETPPAMLTAGRSPRRRERLAVLRHGHQRPAKELHAQCPAAAPLLPWLGLRLLAARALGLAILDGVFNASPISTGFEAECRQGRELGFDGKTLIHPSQVGPGNAIFTPAPEAVDRARAIIAAFAAPDAHSKGVVQLDGRMVERLISPNRPPLVAVADAIAARG